LPATTAPELYALAEASDNDVCIAFDSGIFCAACGPRSIASSLIREPFVPWRRVVPLSSGRGFEVERQELVAALRRLQAVADLQLVPLAVLIGRGDRAEVRLAYDLATAVDWLPVQRGFDGYVTVSLPRALSILEPLDVERVVVDQAAPGATVRIGSPDDPNLIAVVAALAEPPGLAQQLASLSNESVSA
jgi:hypothetical protein